MNFDFYKMWIQSAHLPDQYLLTCWSTLQKNLINRRPVPPKRPIHHPSPDRYEAMQYRRCGNSGLQLPALSLGLWHNFGGVDSPATARELILYAFDAGITHFDLANNYGPPPGSAESTLGQVLKNNLAGYRDELIISTKAGYDMWPGPYGDGGSRKYLLASLDQSLKRLGVEYVDIFYHHRFDPDTPLEETMLALHQAVQQGKALYVGLSNYDPSQTRKAVALLKELRTPVVIHQPKYNMLDRWPEDGLLDTLEELGLGCIPFSPLAQGLLTDRYLDGIPQGSRVSKSHGFLQEKNLTPAVLSTVKSLNPIAGGRGQSLAQMALAWILRQNVVTSVLVGASSIDQLAKNLEALNGPAFTDEELAQIDTALATLL